MSTTENGQDSTAPITGTVAQSDPECATASSPAEQAGSAASRPTAVGQPTSASVPPRDAKPDSVGQTEESQIPEIISAYTMRIRSISRCAREYILLAKKTSHEWMEKFLDVAKSAEQFAKSDPEKCLAAIRDYATKEDVHYHVVNPHSKILSQSLLIFGFSAFDAFVGILLTRLYQEEQQLIYKLEEKTLKISDLLGCKSVKEALDRLIDRDVSGLLRENYDDLFSTLANRHGISTLKRFPNWAKFIEAAQRRNLITHCNGIVNSQYIQACKNAEFTLAPEVVPGYQLEVDADYVQAALDVLYEVGVKLGHVLWRTASPRSIERSERDLTDEIFRLLTREEWSLARTIGEFAVNLPKQKLEIQNRISRINFAQALKWSGDQVGAMRVLDAVDWSGSIRDLRLGVEVLRENYDNAARLMREIGKRGELVLESGYRQWPVFREFRKTEQFAAAFAEVYGTPFDNSTPAAAPSLDVPDAVESIDQCDVTLPVGEPQMPSQQPQDPGPRKSAEV